jgi:hypothetical protein
MCFIQSFFDVGAMMDIFFLLGISNCNIIHSLYSLVRYFIIANQMHSIYHIVAFFIQSFYDVLIMMDISCPLGISKSNIIHFVPYLINRLIITNHIHIL